MSVLKNKRSISDMQFYKTARDLRKKITLQLLPKLKENKVQLPDFITDNFIADTMKTLNEIMEYIVKANAIYPTIEAEVEKRRLLQDDAICSCEHLYSLLEYLIDIYPEQLKNVLLYVDDIDHLIKLLRRWKQSNNKIMKAIAEDKKSGI